MALSHGDRPYGVRDLKVATLPGESTIIDIPIMTLGFSERIVSSELVADDALAAVAAHVQAVEWSISAGGLPLAAYALVTGRTIAETGSTPNELRTLTGSAGDKMPYFKLYGQSLAEEDDGMEIVIYKCKITDNAPDGEFTANEFYQAGITGVAIDDGSNGIFDLVGEETPSGLPAET